MSITPAFTWSMFIQYAALDIFILAYILYHSNIISKAFSLLQWKYQRIYQLC